MASKKKYYDLESEYSDAAAESAAGFSFLDWLKLAEKDSIETAKKRVEQTKVIESFIQNAPKIKPVKKGEEILPVSDESDDNEGNGHLKSEDIVSETLAQIYEEQGLFTRAAQVYDKLRLINPEKSNYFAARLKELKKKESEFKK